MAAQNFPRSAFGGIREVLSEQAFSRMLTLERKRSEISRRPFALLVLDSCTSTQTADSVVLWATIFRILHTTTRECDLAGWLKTNSSAGVILTEVEPNNDFKCLLCRISHTLQQRLAPDQFSRVRFRCSRYPEADSQTTQVAGLAAALIAGSLEAAATSVPCERERGALVTVRKSGRHDLSQAFIGGAEFAGAKEL